MISNKTCGAKNKILKQGTVFYSLLFIFATVFPHSLSPFYYYHLICSSSTSSSSSSSSSGSGSVIYWRVLYRNC